MRIDRYTLLHGLRSAAVREQARREALLAAKAEEAREWLDAKYSEMARNLGLESPEESGQDVEP